jgi:integrase
MRTAKLSIGVTSIKNKDGKRIRYWRVTSPRLGGGSVRRFFKDRMEAETYHGQQKRQLTNYGIAGASMDERLRGDALLAHEILAPLGLSLNEAAQHYAEHIKSTHQGITLEKAVEELLLARAREQCSKIYQRALKYRLTRFVEAYPNWTCRQIKTIQIDEFLTSLGGRAATVNTFRKDIRTLFNHLRSRELCKQNPADHALSIKETRERVKILSPAEARNLLESCDPVTLPSIAIAVFCGLRTSEVARLEWEDVNLLEGVIRLEAVKSKTQAMRVIKIPDCCVAWLIPYAQRRGQITSTDFRNQFDKVRVKAGYRPSYGKRRDSKLQELLTAVVKKNQPLTPWQPNVLRHTAISYRLAEIGDIGVVSTWAGNSPSVIRNHYLSLVSEAEAFAFYSIRPTKK